MELLTAPARTKTALADHDLPLDPLTAPAMFKSANTKEGDLSTAAHMDELADDRRRRVGLLQVHRRVAREQEAQERPALPLNRSPAHDEQILAAAKARVDALERKPVWADWATASRRRGPLRRGRRA